MNLNTELKVEQKALLDEIEARVREIFSAQKNKVEQSLVEKINREKEEAQKRIEAVNQEFAQVRGFLDEHKTVMTGLQSAEQVLRGEIRGHFERAVNYQKMMEHAAVLAGEELEKIGELNQELEKVRVKAEGEYADLKERLSGYAGIVAQIPVPAAKTEASVDWSEELTKLRKVRDLLSTLRQDEFGDAAEADNHVCSADASPAEESSVAAPSEAETDAAPATETLDEPAAVGPTDLENNGVTEADLAENYPAWAKVQGNGNDHPEESAAPAEEASAEAAEVPVETPAEAQAEPQDETQPEAAEAEAPAECAAETSADQAAILESLAHYRRTESVNNGIELGFFTAQAGSYLDADSFMSALGKVIAGASHLHAQMPSTTSVKDLFLLKQEILNQQEILRKVFFRIVRFCVKEGGHLPESLAEIISSQGMKDIVERLTMANWSDPSDFNPFLKELTSLKSAFEARAAASPCYLQSVLDEVEGRKN